MTIALGIFGVTSFLAGCGSGVMATASSQADVVKITGIVHGGQQVVANATIQLYAVGTTGTGSAATPLLTTPVRTDNSGGFSLTGTYTCPSPLANVYLVATGGNPGLSSGQNNTSIAMMSALGHCLSLTTHSYLSVSEVTTVAAVYALAPYMHSYNSVGAAASDYQLIDAAFYTAQELANIETGTTPGPIVVPGHTVQVQKLQTLANILSACINTAGGQAGDPNPCGSLFADAAYAGNTPTDTIGALVNIALNPTNNVTSIFNINPSYGPFQPSLNAAPADWNLSLTSTPTPTPASTALSILSAGLPADIAGATYLAQLQAVGGMLPYAWSVTSGQLPAGLSLDPKSGVISGTPQTTGLSNFVIAVSDASHPTQVVSVPLSIVSLTPLSITSSSLSSGTAGTGYSASLQASGGTQPYTWSIASGSLPAGLTLAATTGVISGTPVNSGVTNFTVAVTDSSLLTQRKTAATSITVVAAPPPGPTTWYVRPDGGTRYSTNVTAGQCDGLGDAPYPGSGVNQHCAFNDIRLLNQDGSYANSGSTFPALGWVGKGGDTYIIRGSIAAGTQPYRVGWDTASGAESSNPAIQYAAERGLHGDPVSSGLLSPPAGTASQHTRILGENWQNCHAQSSRTPVIGGHNVGTVFNFSTSYVDFQCFDISDLSDCKNNCNGMDSATAAIGLQNVADHLTITDVRMHGMQTFGMLGPSGDGSVFTYVAWVGNGGGGWNADAGDGKTGLGTLLVQHYEIKWNGCAEEYPIVDSLPYENCTDQSSGGYGDGFGTATVMAQAPGWQVHFDQGEVAYNTQDGLDALHLVGNNSSMTITRTLAYANMGQQIKVGGAAGTAENNVIVGNCNAMSNAIPGTPSGYNTNLSDFCRAGNQPVLGTTGHGSTLRIRHNTIMGAGALLISYNCDPSNGTTCDSTALVDLRDNILIGNPDATRGNPSGNYILVGDTTYTDSASCNAAPDGHHYWTTDGFTGCINNVFGNAGSYNDHNVYWNVKDLCTDNYGTNNLCASPGLVSETEPAYGYPDLSLSSNGGAAFHAGVNLQGLLQDYSILNFASSPSIGALEAGSPLIPYKATE